MNSVHDSKEWQMPSNALPSPSVGESPMQPPVPHYPTMDHAYPQSFSQAPPLPMQQQPASPTHNNYPVKPDSDPRLPGMMAVSQPSTPRPSPAATNDAGASPTRNSNTANAAAAVAAYSTPSFHTSPYMSAGVIPRKRGRSDSLFPQESGPFFSSTKPFDNLYSVDRSNLLSIRIQSKMDRGFFLADNDWTCYRRNYFQVSSAFSIHGMSHYYTDHEPQCLVRSEDGNNFYPVRRFLLGISARVSNNDKRIELVQHTPKRDKGPQMTPQPKPITPGGNLSMSSVGTNQNIVTFERIQFKTATANNGKRRAAQQYYVCVTDLYAETDHGEQIKIASCQSAPLVVRGRSPGHYTDSQQERTPSAVVPPPPPPPHHHHHTAAPPPPVSSPLATSTSSSSSQQIALPPPPHHDERFAFQRPPYTPPGMMPSEYGYYSSYPHFSPPMHAPLPPNVMMNNGPPTPTQHTPSSSGPPPSPQPYASTHGPPPPPPPHHPYMLSSVARSHSQHSTSAYY